MSENFFSDLQSKIENTDLLLNEAEDFSFDVPEEAKSASKDDVQLGSKDPSDEERKDYDPTKDPEVSDLIDNDDDEDDDDYEDDDEEALEDAVEDNDPAHESLDNIIESVVGKTFDTELMDKINSVYNESVLNLNTRTNEMIDYIIEGYNGLLEGDKLLIEGLLQEQNSFDSLFNNELLNESPLNPRDDQNVGVENHAKVSIVTIAKIIRKRVGKNAKVKFREANMAGKASEYIPQIILGATVVYAPAAAILAAKQASLFKVYTLYVEENGHEVWKKSISIPHEYRPADVCKAIESVMKTGKAKIGQQTIHEGIDLGDLDEELFTYVENDEGGVTMLFDESLLEDEYGFYDETDAMDAILESNDVDFMTEDTDSWLYEAEDETAEDEDGSLEEDFWMEAEDEEDLEEATPVAIQADQAADFDPLSSLKSMDESWFDEEDETAEDEDGSLEEDFWMEAEDEEEDLEEAWYFEDDDEDSDDDDDDSDDDDKDEDDDDKKDKDKDDDDKDEDDDDKKNESFYDFDFGW